MNKKEICDMIEAKLNDSDKKIRNLNAIDALCTLFPPASALWKVFTGSQEALTLVKTQITQDTILDLLVAIDQKLETGKTDASVFEVLLDGVVAYGDVSGLKASTSNPVVARLFSEKEINVVLKNVQARGNVTGVDLKVEQELELKKRMHIKTPFARIDFNAGPNCKITFGKGLKRKNED